jgi:hypothetical protein
VRTLTKSMRWRRRAPRGRRGLLDLGGAAAAVGGRGVERDDLAGLNVLRGRIAPETIAVKERLVSRLDRVLADPRPDDQAWRRALRGDVAAPDAISRPFAACDRVRFGGAVPRGNMPPCCRAASGRASRLVHRPQYDCGAHVWISCSSDLRNWGGHKLTLAARKGAWWDDADRDTIRVYDGAADRSAARDRHHPRAPALAGRAREAVVTRDPDGRC